MHFHLKGRIIQREGEAERNLPSAGSFPRWLQRPGLSQSKARTQDLFWVSHGASGAPGLDPSFAAFPDHEQGVGPQWSNRDMSWCQCRMPAWQAEDCNLARSCTGLSSFCLARDWIGCVSHRPYFFLWFNLEWENSVCSHARLNAWCTKGGRLPSWNLCHPVLGLEAGLWWKPHPSNGNA